MTKPYTPSPAEIAKAAALIRAENLAAMAATDYTPNYVREPQIRRDPRRDWNERVRRA